MDLTRQQAAPKSLPSNAHLLYQPVVSVVINMPLLPQELSTHPDPSFVHSLLSDLRHGCQISYTGPRVGHVSCNLCSVLIHKEVVFAELIKEVTLGHLAGPFEYPPHPNICCSGIGIVEKKQGGYWTIMHLLVGVTVSSGNPSTSILCFTDRVFE